MEEIQVQYRRDAIRWSEETAVLDCQTRAGAFIKVICDCTPGELEPGLHYRFSGSWTYHKKYGQQFKANFFTLDMPVTETAVTYYLKRYSGIGEKTAKALWLSFGENALEVIAERPEELQKYKISKENAEEIASHIAVDLTESKTQLELAAYLGGYRLPRTLFQEVYKDYGVKSLEFVRRNPYLLLKYERCGFKLVDAFAIAKGFPPTRLKRQALAILYRLESVQDVWITTGEANAALMHSLEMHFGETRFRDAVKLLLRAKKIVGQNRGNTAYISTKRDAENEIVICREVQRHLIPNHPVEMNLDGLSDSQKSALTGATKYQIGCFTGGPGTGKTFSVSRYIEAIISTYGEESVCVVAPTGKAMVRSREALQAIGIQCETRTIHSLLLAQESGIGKSYKFIVSDESSMIDADLMRRFLVANPESSLLFVGDDGQLLPVGKGRPFADFLQCSRFPAGMLTETRRNSGLIVEACHAIRHGNSWNPVTESEMTESANLIHVPSSNNLRTIERLIEFYKQQGRDPRKELQVICGVNKGESGILELNPLIREMHVPGVDSRYIPGDPVICLKNDYYLDASEPEADWTNNETKGTVYVSNGEIGMVYEQKKGMTLADFGQNRKVRFKHGNLKFSLAYAVTCHKMQGSEIPIAVVLLDGSFGASMVCSREWLYTAISRAKEVCYLVGSLDVARAFCRKLAAVRKTFLARDLEEVFGC